MRIGLPIGAAIVGFCSAIAVVPATAASPAPHSWTGWYVGANAGYAWGHSDVASSFTCPMPGDCPYNAPASHTLFSAAGSGPLSPRGFTAGGQAGYNWQSGNAVIGAEVDFGAFKLRKTRTVGGPTIGEGGDNFVMTTGVESNWLFTARGRLGWTVTPTALLYATGGLAVTDLKVSNSFVDDASTIIGITVNTVGASSKTQAKAGWTAGGGLELALSANWTVKAEYLHVNFGSVSTLASVYNTSVAPPSPNFLATTADLRAHIARAGLNFRFGPN